MFQHPNHCFSLSGSIISSYFWKIVLLNLSFLTNFLNTFSTLHMSSHCLLITIHFWEVNHFCYSSSHVQFEMSFHCLLSRFTFVFEHFYYNVFHNGLLSICPVWSFSISWMYRFALFFISAKFPDIIYLIHLLSFSLFLFPLVYPSHNLVCLIVSQISEILFFIFSLFLSLFFRLPNLYSSVFNLLILSYDRWSLLLSPSTEFLFGLFYFSSSEFPFFFF